MDTIHVHAIIPDPTFTASDADIASMLKGASDVYRAANIEFVLASVERTDEPALVKDKGPSVPSGGVPLEFELARVARAVQYPGRLVMFLRTFHPTDDFKGGNYSDYWPDYVVIGALDPALTAHEMGHHFRLRHTHDDGYLDVLYKTNWHQGYPAALQAARDLIKDNGMSCFDGDLPEVTDTPPDVGTPLFERSGYDAGGTALKRGESCSGRLELDVEGYPEPVDVTPDRTNVMSYFFGCDPQPKVLSNDQTRIVRQSLDSGNRRHLLAGASFEGPAAACVGSSLHVFARGDDRNIWHNRREGEHWLGWKDDIGGGGETFTSGPSAASLGSGALHVFARGDDRDIWHNWWNGQEWVGWHDDLGKATLTSAPASVALGSSLHVFARGDDRNIWHNWWNGAEWVGWRDDIGGGGETFTSGPAAALLGANALHVFARGDDRNIWHNWWNGEEWAGWRDDIGGGGETFTSGPSAASQGSDALHVFARGDDRNIWHDWWNGQEWVGWHNDMGGGWETFTSGAGATAPGADSIQVFAEGDDRSIWRNHWSPNGWRGWEADIGGGTFAW